VALATLTSADTGEPLFVNPGRVSCFRGHEDGTELIFDGGGMVVSEDPGEVAQALSGA
jgi:hypothetical protein